ncbi:MAG: LysR family transcriptional regulator [Deltaproteobacteria bacterium]|nr:LysR family transcriptional regulator [Deltaproteobacteria bacterium]MBW2016490.1 LysR family transcriptional regulator [Deltaproteobacteria bacterium]MBW2128494.1 LysR family transcriptional regulator [Deltaproteobacteria bacterium]MBW2303647.1 LysR family transcriptional regulator [Deltaproteobacteria bacterium]
MINFNQLRVFHCVAKNLSFTQAAKELFITQPAVTAQMKLFEDYCGVKLFKKKGRKIFLTEEGKTLYNYTCKIFDYEKEIEGLLEDMRKLKRGILRIGTSKTYARYLMPHLMRDFHERHPQIKIHLDEGSSQSMVHSLMEMRNEVAIVAKVEESPEVEFVPFSQEELVLIISPNHPFKQKPFVTVEELSHEPIIMKELGSGTRKLINELFKRNGYVPNILIETSNAEFIKQLVERGDGISFLVKASVSAELRAGRLASVPIKGENIYLEVNIVYLKNQPLSPSAQAFLKTLDHLASGKRPLGGVRALFPDSNNFS